MCGVYKITNLINGKIYVGSSKNIKNRWKQHKDKLNEGIHGNMHLQNAWNKYGKNNFSFEVIEECEPSIQFEREQYYLNQLNPFDSNGYNIIRQISKEYMSDHYLIKKCLKCHKDYSTFSHLSKYCDECKERMKEENAEAWYEQRGFNISNKSAERSFMNLMSSIYGSADAFWESEI